MNTGAESFRWCSPQVLWCSTRFDNFCTAELTSASTTGDLFWGERSLPVQLWVQLNPGLQPYFPSADEG